MNCLREAIECTVYPRLHVKIDCKGVLEHMLCNGVPSLICSLYLIMILIISRYPKSAPDRTWFYNHYNQQNFMFIYVFKAFFKIEIQIIKI